jgi:hypothetical protein
MPGSAHRGDATAQRGDATAQHGNATAPREDVTAQRGNATTQWARSAAHAAGPTALVAAGFALVAGVGIGLAAIAGFAAAPRVVPAVLAVAAAASLGWAAAPLVRAARAAVRGVAPSATGPAERATGPQESSTGRTERATGPQESPPETVERATSPHDSPTGTAKRTTGPDRSPSTPADPQPRRAPRSHRRPALASPVRTAVVAGAVVLLGLVCWLHPGEPGLVLFGLARASVGLFVYALPLVPLLALVPAAPRPPVAWVGLWRDRKALALGLSAARVVRDAVLGRAAGLVLATVALLHLLRGRPGLEESAYQLAGGLLGIAAATPLAGLFSPAGAFGVVLAVLAGVATVTAGHLYRPLGRYPALATLVLLLVAPVVAGGVSNRVGYRHFLGVDGDRVVVIAGLSPHHRHETYDAGVVLAALPAPLHPVLRKAFPVVDRDDGTRVAAALADPTKAAADGMPDGGLTLRTGECFSFVGGTSNFRYTVPCNGEHVGEVFYVGRLPFSRDPGTAVRTAAARGACEKAYGGYLGAPYGTSYLPIEPPVVQRDLVACLFAALGPWPLKGTRTVATLQQPLDWSPGPGCAVEPGLRFTAAQPAQVCVAPGRAVTAAGTAPITVDAEFQPVGRGAGNARVGVACLSGDAVAGYYATVGGDGVLTLVKRQGTAGAPLGSAGKARSAPSPQTAVTQVQLTCRPEGSAVRVVASAGKGRQLAVTDQQGVTPLSPRLVVESAEAPVTAAVTLFTAKVV